MDDNCLSCDSDDPRSKWIKFCEACLSKKNAVLSAAAKWWDRTFHSEPKKSRQSTERLVHGDLLTEAKRRLKELESTKPHVREAQLKAELAAKINILNKLGLEVVQLKKQLALFQENVMLLRVLDEDKDEVDKKHNIEIENLIQKIEKIQSQINSIKKSEDMRPESSRKDQAESAKPSTAASK